MTFKSGYDMYDVNIANIKDLNNKLFCTFTSGEELDELVSELSTVYTIMYNKMFVLFVKSTNEYVITYNVEQGNVNSIPVNTILVHRKKESNTLYTINALNTLIKSLNNGNSAIGVGVGVNLYDKHNILLNVNTNQEIGINYYFKFQKFKKNK